MNTSEKTDKVYEALFNVKKEMGGVAKTSNNPFFKSKYADLNSHLDVAEPLLEKWGCMILQPPTVTVHGLQAVTTRIVHAASGQWIEGSMLLQSSKPDMQQLGAAVTYGRRFILSGLLGMKAEDDDGNFASGKTVDKVATIGTVTITGSPVSTKPAASFKRPVTKPTESVSSSDGDL
jgi:hypothetical protein